MLKLPKTRYQGSKTKLLEHIYQQIKINIPQCKCILELFGGTSIVSLFLKSKGFIMKLNTYVAQCLLNSCRKDLSTDEEIRNVFIKSSSINYLNIVENNSKIFFHR